MAKVKLWGVKDIADWLDLLKSENKNKREDAIHALSEMLVNGYATGQRDYFKIATAIAAGREKGHASLALADRACSLTRRQVVGRLSGCDRGHTAGERGVGVIGARGRFDPQPLNPEGVGSTFREFPVLMSSKCWGGPARTRARLAGDRRVGGRQGGRIRGWFGRNRGS